MAENFDQLVIMASDGMQLHSATLLISITTSSTSISIPKWQQSGT